MSSLPPASAARSLFAWAAARATSTSPLLVDRSLPHGARVELSGRVGVNWWAKNAGLLQSEFGIGVDSHVVLDLDASWRSLPLALAALGLGARLSEDPSASADADLLITSEPHGEAASTAAELLAVTTSPLAMSFGEELPSHAVDHAAEVRAQPDRLVPDPGAAERGCWMPNGPDSPNVSLAELLATPRPAGRGGATGWIHAERGMLPALRALLATGEAGALLLVASASPDPALLEQERATFEA